MNALFLFLSMIFFSKKDEQEEQEWKFGKIQNTVLCPGIRIRIDRIWIARIWTISIVTQFIKSVETFMKERRACLVVKLSKNYVVVYIVCTYVVFLLLVSATEQSEDAIVWSLPFQDRLSPASQR